MSKIKDIGEKVDKLINQLSKPKDIDFTISNCKLYLIKDCDFFIAVARNNKKFVLKAGRYIHNPSFNGYLAGKYTTDIYSLLRYMVLMGILLEEEQDEYASYLREQDKKAIQKSEINRAKEVLKKYNIDSLEQ